MRGFDAMQESQIQLAIELGITRFAAELIDSLDSRIYWNREAGSRKVAAALEDVKHSVESAVEEFTR